jgi:hypothetical protein
MSWCRAIIAVCIGAIFLVDFNCCVSGDLKPHCLFFRILKAKIILFLHYVLSIFGPLSEDGDTLSFRNVIRICICIMDNRQRISPRLIQETIFAKQSTGLWCLLPFGRLGFVDGSPASYFECLDIVRLKTDCTEFLSPSSQM